MSARTIRRTFAAPVVITLASSLGGGCTPAPPHHTENPPGPRMPPEMPPNDRPPTEPVKQEPAKLDRRWSISKKPNSGATECYAAAETKCPKNAPCNPPMPQNYACPDGFGADSQLTIVLREGATDCFVDYGDTSCPKGATCNPPPPRKLPCPK